MDEQFDVGARLREIRSSVGLSQRALAERAGVPHGQISLIETNRNSPSVATLRKILGGVPITMSDFFEPDHLKSGEVFFDGEELLDLTSRLPAPSRKGKARIWLRQVGDAHAHNLQIMHERYSPGADTGASMLDHNAHEGGIVVEGEIEVTVGSQRRVLKSGDAYLFDSRVPHRFRNLSKTQDAIVISACTPPYL
ncbi:cupin domain-containing protein [Sphingobium nicotianae]|uniref:Cupin domain-containing protein n=1 Tax=Sphingobium nicotianae TaxID=2782607 RepID=A0A9X1D9X3_9SPHN|nr:cupin domain-containing protein [Sphingobium nicotianae]MBT2186051.1 cupin domain-containing protein [Sphingobium nicotianae]